MKIINYFIYIPRVNYSENKEIQKQFSISFKEFNKIILFSLLHQIQLLVKKNNINY